MTLRVNTSFNGVEYQDTRVGADVVEVMVDSVAGDDAMSYEVLTNKTAAGTGGAPTTNVGHNHSEGNNRLYRCFMTHCWGTGEENESSENLGLAIATDASTPGKTPGTTLFAFPMFIASQWIDHDIEMLATGAVTAATEQFNSLGITVIIKDSTMTEVTRFGLLVATDVDNIDNGDLILFSGTFSVPSAGVYVVEAQVDMESVFRISQLLQISVAPVFRLADRDSPRGKAQTPPLPEVGANIATVPTWQPIDTRIVTNQNPLGPALVLLTQNQNRLYEEATGLEAPGNLTATATGHDHDGSNSRPLEFNVLSIPFGSTGDDAEIYGNGAQSPYVENTGTSATTRTIRQFYAQMPTSALVTPSVNSILKCAVLVHCAAAGAGKTVVIVTGGSGAGSISQYTQTTTGLQLIAAPTAGDTTLAYSSGTLSRFTVEMKATVNNAASAPRIVGLCLYFKE